MEYAETLGRDHAFPESASLDVERRSAAAAADASDAPEAETERRMRTVRRDTGVSDSAKVYLREMYTDTNGDMWCQGCQSRMPFKIKGAWYFVARQCVLGRRYEHRQNFLALCPLCAARYQHVRDTTDDALLLAIEDLKIDDGQGQVSLPVILNGKRVELRFSGRHALDMRTALAVAGDARENSDQM